MTEPIVRACTKCGTILPATLEFFYAYKKGRNGLCSACKQCYRDYHQQTRAVAAAYMKQWQAENREERKEYMKQWGAENREDRQDYMKRWGEKHRERRLRYYADYHQVNREHIRRYDRERRKQPWIQLADNMSRAVRHSLKHGKHGASWESLVGYTVDELRCHLESMFCPGMSWDNYGKQGWEIDHVRPVSSFNFASVQDPDFQACWALSNLQPLWRWENAIKSHKAPDQYLAAIAEMAAMQGGQGVPQAGGPGV